MSDTLLLPSTPTNPDYLQCENRFNNDLFDSCYGCASIDIIEQYVRQISNVEKSITKKEKISKLERLKQLDLIGSLNDRDVTSNNYKDIIYGNDE